MKRRTWRVNNYYCPNPQRYFVWLWNHLLLHVSSTFLPELWRDILELLSMWWNYMSYACEMFSAKKNVPILFSDEISSYLSSSPRPIYSNNSNFALHRWSLSLLIMASRVSIFLKFQECTIRHHQNTKNSFVHYTTTLRHTPFSSQIELIYFIK